MTKVEILQKQLEEAEQAYHELMIGARTVSVNVEGVGSTSYAQADSSKLKEYTETAENIEVMAKRIASLANISSGE